MPITVNEIAQKCGVSRTTVLRALNENGSVGEKTREKILAVAEEYNYRPNLLARSLKHGRTMSLGVVTINVENLYFVQSLNSINREAEKHGYFTNIVVCDDNTESEKKLIRELADRQMEGLLISPINKGKEFEDFLLSLNIPVVCIGNNVSDSLTTVGVNEMKAAQEAVELIVSKGYDTVVFVCPPLSMSEQKNIYSHEQRLEGVKKAEKEFTDKTFMVIESMDYANEALKLLKKNKQNKIAFLCSGDEYALKLMKYVGNEGYTAPDNFGLMGFDNIGILDYITPRLTTVATNFEGVASTAVNELLHQIEEKEYVAKSICLNYKIMDCETL